MNRGFRALLGNLRRIKSGGEARVSLLQPPLQLHLRRLLLLPPLSFHCCPCGGARLSKRGLVQSGDRKKDGPKVTCKFHV